MASLREYVINAVAATVTVAAGGTLISSKVELAQHEERIARIEKLDEQMDRLSDKLDAFQIDLTRVETKQDARP